MIDLNSLSRPWNRICDGAFLQSATRTRMLLIQSRSTSRWHSSPSDIERIQLTTLLFVDSRISRYDNYHVCRRSFHDWTRVRSPHLHFKSIRSSLMNVRHNFRTAIPDDFHFHILMIHDISDVCFLSFLVHNFFTVIEEDLISIIIQSAIGHMIDNDQKKVNWTLKIIQLKISFWSEENPIMFADLEKVIFRKTSSFAITKTRQTNPID